MAREIKETAHLNTDLKKLHKNWDSIDCGNKKMNNFYDEYGMIHDKPVTIDNPFPCNDSMILTAIADKLGVTVDHDSVFYYYCDLEFSPGKYPIERIPGKKDPMPSRDFFLGAAYFYLIDMKKNNWNFSPIKLPRLNIFKLVSQLMLCIGKDRKYFWQNNLTQVYHTATMIPIQDREFHYRCLRISVPFIYKLISAIDKKIKPDTNSAKFISYLKYDYNPTIEDWLEKCNGYKDHPIYLKALELKRGI